jgi:hypothetical protein
MSSNCKGCVLRYTLAYCVLPQAHGVPPQAQGVPLKHIMCPHRHKVYIFISGKIGKMKHLAFFFYFGLHIVGTDNFLKTNIFRKSTLITQLIYLER